MQNVIFSTRRAALVALALGCVLLLLGLTSKGPFIRTASEYSAEIASSSAATFLSLRGINAAISFAEEVEVGGSLVFTGSVHPFKMLEPIDDAVERLSSTIFVVGAVSGIMTVVLPVLGNLAFSLSGAALVALATLQLSGFVFLGRTVLTSFFQGIARLGGLAFLVVFAFSISSWFAEGISDRAWGQYESLLKDVSSDVESSMPDLSEDDVPIGIEPAESSTDNAEPKAIPTIETGGDTGLVAKSKEFAEGITNIVQGAVSSTSSAISSSKDAVEDLMSATNSNYQRARSVALTLTTRKDDLVEALIGIFATFIFKTIVFPLLILFGLMRVFNSFGFNRRDAVVS